MQIFRWFDKNVMYRWGAVIMNADEGNFRKFAFASWLTRWSFPPIPIDIGLKQNDLETSSWIRITNWFHWRLLTQCQPRDEFSVSGNSKQLRSPNTTLENQKYTVGIELTYDGRCWASSLSRCWSMRLTNYYQLVALMLNYSDLFLKYTQSMSSIARDRRPLHSSSFLTSSPLLTLLDIRINVSWTSIVATWYYIHRLSCTCQQG